MNVILLSPPWDMWFKKDDAAVLTHTQTKVIGSSGSGGLCSITSWTNT